MSKKKMAVTIESEHRDTSRYSNLPMDVHLRTWDCGIRVEMHLDKDENPIFTILVTGGSHAPRNKFELGSINARYELLKKGE
jgi:hypothetical protein